MVVLQPIWAARPGFDCKPQANEAGITLQTYRHQLGDIVAEFENTCCLSAADLLPAVPEFVPDGVHPNDPGHHVTGENLAELLGEL